MLVFGSLVSMHIYRFEYMPMVTVHVYLKALITGKHHNFKTFCIFPQAVKKKNRGSLKLNKINH